MYLDWWELGILALGYGICYWQTYNRAARNTFDNTLAWLVHGRVIYFENGKILPVQHENNGDNE